MLKLKRHVNFVALAAACAVLSCNAATASGKTPVVQQINPQFLKYVQERRTAAQSQPEVGQSSSPLRATGFLPSSYTPAEPVIFSTLNVKPRFSYSVLSSSYDVRWEGRAPAVRDQGNCGSCWAFAALGSLESNAMPSNEYHFDEQRMDIGTGYDSAYYGFCNGGTTSMATSYLARWGGPVGFGTTRPVLRYAQDIVYLTKRAAWNDNARIKAALLAYGAVFVSFRVTADAGWIVKGDYYNPATSAFYYTGSGSTNHAVMIMGWDDNYAASNFSTAPPGPGAFIVKNSWGTGWGDKGYFHVSYYDTLFGRLDYAVAYTSVSPVAYSRLYDYDPLGWVLNLGFGSTTAWLGNIFTAAADAESVNAVGFYTTQEDASYTVSVYTDVVATPTDGTLALAQSGTFAGAGYHVLPLSTAVNLVEGQKFSVVAKVTEASTLYPVVISAALYGLSSAAPGPGGPGRSFVSADGSDWTDTETISLGTAGADKSVSASIKAYASGGTNADADVWFKTLRVYPSPAHFEKGALLQFSDIEVNVPLPEIYIYTVTGRLVRHLTEASGEIGPYNGLYKRGVWDGRNSDGEKVATGVYVYVAKSGGTVKKGKVGVSW